MARPIKRTAEEALEDALAYYLAGKSVRECEKLTGTNFMKVEREAKKRGLVKGSVLRLEESMAKDRAEFVTLPVTVQARVTADVDERTKYLQYFKDANLLHSDIAIKKLKLDGVKISYAELNSSINVVSKAQDGVMGKQPDTAFQVNNNIDTGVTELLKRAMGTALRPPR